MEGGGGGGNTPVGGGPAPAAIDTSGLDLDADTVAKLVEVDPESWRAELPQLDEHYKAIGDTVPADLREQLTALEKRLAGG
jgi:phosphoenolpyruvate carboxykinase (GTP)